MLCIFLLSGELFGVEYLFRQTGEAMDCYEEDLDDTRLQMDDDEDAVDFTLSDIMDQRSVPVECQISTSAGDPTNALCM